MLMDAEGTLDPKNARGTQGTEWWRGGRGHGHGHGHGKKMLASLCATLKITDSIFEN